MLCFNNVHFLLALFKKQNSVIYITIIKHYKLILNFRMLDFNITRINNFTDFADISNTDCRAKKTYVLNAGYF